jgi:hypothetical protein
MLLCEWQRQTGNDLPPAIGRNGHDLPPRGSRCAPFQASYRVHRSSSGRNDRKTGGVIRRSGRIKQLPCQLAPTAAADRDVIPLQWRNLRPAAKLMG